MDSSQVSENFPKSCNSILMKTTQRDGKPNVPTVFDTSDKISLLEYQYVPDGLKQ